MAETHDLNLTKRDSRVFLPVVILSPTKEIHGFAAPSRQTPNRNYSTISQSQKYSEPLSA